MQHDDSQEDVEVELLAILITSDGWKVFEKYAAMSRQATLESLAFETKLEDIYRLQGSVSAFDSLLSMPKEAIRDARTRQADRDV